MSDKFFQNIPDYAITAVKDKIQKAREEWNNLANEFAAENVIMGITQANKTKLIQDALNEVNIYGQMGSLWEAYKALDRVVVVSDMAPFLTEARKQWMKNKIIQVLASL